MNKFEFKLAPLLKLREFEEEKIKINLGKINQEIESIEDEKKYRRELIKKYYNVQMESINHGSKASEIVQYPLWIESEKRKIEFLQQRVKELENSREEVVEDLYFAMGKTKVLKKLEHKKKTEFLKSTQKKRENEREDLVIMNNRYKRKEI